MTKVEEFEGWNVCKWNRVGNFQDIENKHGAAHIAGR
jgi:hypothetical protein